MNKNIDKIIKNLFQKRYYIKNNTFIISQKSDFINQNHTNNAFSNKWKKYDKQSLTEKNKLFEFQKKWFLKLYNFPNENSLKSYLSKKKIILDAGSGMGQKAKWFADLSPKSLVIGMDYSESIFLSAKNYGDTPNLVFVKGDISNTKIKSDSIDYINCDQVIHHTEDPKKTLKEFNRILKKGFEVGVYVYAKKALPRELIDDYFREKSKDLSYKQIWELSTQLTELGKRLSKLKIKIDVPEIPFLGIKSGKIDLQRFIYWNFLKCFWDEKRGEKSSISCNFDWYSPSNAFRFNKNEFEEFIKEANFKIRPYHAEFACYSGRFKKI